MHNAVIVAFIALAVATLLAASAAQRPRAALWSKASASLGFVVLGVFNSQGGDSFDRFVLLGLLLAALGDIALALPHPRAFLVGVGAFALGHLAYLAAACVHAGPEDVPAYALAVWAPSILVFRWLSPRLGELRVAVFVYVIIISLMVIGALSLHGPAADRAWLFVLGALLFYCSDLSVARDRFVHDAFVNKAWGLPAYYAGQVCIALSTASL